MPILLGLFLVEQRCGVSGDFLPNSDDSLTYFGEGAAVLAFDVVLKLCFIIFNYNSNI